MFLFFGVKAREEMARERLRYLEGVVCFPTLTFLLLFLFSSFVGSKLWCVTFDWEEGQGDVPSDVPDNCIYKGFSLLDRWGGFCLRAAGCVQ